MKTLSLSEVKAKLSELVDQVESRDERVVITRKGRPAAVLVSHDDLESWQETLEITSDRALMTEIRRGIRQLERGQAVSYEELFGPRPRGKKRSAHRAR
ncbi:MAG TPA: type II toxin-antitoxin system Phd/YefM family antitoxin [Candidatus Limnocylindria bacterium]|jgi:prevent-host-death family protein|nr:type II toxin-antitoxin system Phd/YefM family antitoxin [Candidatus Limnocylindria bacterium]